MTRIPYNPKKHQEIAFNFALNRHFVALFLDMGLGKTVTTLTLIKHLLYSFEINKPLIIAPKFVTEQTWPEELDKWAHLEGLTYSVIMGNPEKRLRALRAPADMYIISWDNIDWLVSLKKFKHLWPFDMMVLDESTKVKSRDSARFKAVQRVRPRLKRLIELSGTPASNGLMDIWSQMKLLDHGEALFAFIEKFRATYFSARGLSHGGKVYDILPGVDEIIFDKIKHQVLSMKAVDWLTLPKRQDIIRMVELDDYTEFKKFKAEKILELPEGEITALNASALYNKLLQYANGAVYDNELRREWHEVHTKTLDVLEEMLDALQGKPVIIFYQFQADVDRIKKRIPKAVKMDNAKYVDRWNKGEFPVLLLHGAGASHGLNMQYGGHYIIHYGVGDNMEWYWQGVKRLDRQGQEFPVFNYHIMVKGTGQQKVWRGLVSKTLTNDKLMEACKGDY